MLTGLLKVRWVSGFGALLGCLLLGSCVQTDARGPHSEGENREPEAAAPEPSELLVEAERVSEAQSSPAGPPERAFAHAPWWTTPYPDQFDASQLRHDPPAIVVRGNQFVDESGAVRVFQGVSIADPDFLTREGKWSARLFREVKNWGANVVRIPVHPASYEGIGAKAYLALLDQALIWANEQQLYVIVDWHSIGNLGSEMFQHPMYETTRRKTFSFWRAVAHRYAGISTFAFYELFNEPTVYNGTLGDITWEEWKSLNEQMIDIIYAHDREVIPLVAGFNWAYELESVRSNPIEAEGIAYVSHPYPMKTQAPFEQNWERAFGYVADEYPLFATEIGYMPADGPGAHDPVIDDGSYGPRMTDYLDTKGASWVAWVFHPKWSPQLIADWGFSPTKAGTHFREVMQRRAEAENSEKPKN